MKYFIDNSKAFSVGNLGTLKNLLFGIYNAHTIIVKFPVSSTKDQ